MTKIFNKTRRQILNKNKTKRYLKYAFGEIILVVVGILIALQINTWNETRKSKNEEQKILTALQSDFKASKFRIEETIEAQTRVTTSSEVMIKIYERKNPEDYKYLDTHLDSLDYLTSYSTSWYRAEPVTGAYNSLISAGKIDLVQNEDLRHLLAQFAADLESGFEDHEPSLLLMSRLEDVISSFTLKISATRFRNRLNIKPRKIEELKISESLFKNDTFFGYLYLRLFNENNRIIRQKSLLKQTKAILALIDKELNKE